MTVTKPFPKANTTFEANVVSTVIVRIKDAINIITIIMVVVECGYSRNRGYNY